VRTLTAAERAKERAMLLDPTRWPRWPWLPVKKIGEHGPVAHGLVYADDTDEGQPLQVWPFLDYKPAAWIAITNGQGDELAAQVEAAGHGKVVKYEDVDALLDDGWVVD
jgi:hypothetical protein